MKNLTENEAKEFLKKWRIPVTKEFLAKNQKEAVRLAKKLRFPVVLKISSPQILHKTDADGVIVDIQNEKEVLEGFDKIIKNAKKYNPKAEIKGVLVQEMVKGHDFREVIIGSKKDLQFGPVIMFGLGGIFVEVLKDVSFRIIPIERKDAKEMISEIRGYKILKGVRGQKPISFKALEDCLLNVSKMVWKNKKINELDINPLFVNSKRLVAVDARIIME